MNNYFQDPLKILFYKYSKDSINTLIVESLHSNHLNAIQDKNKCGLTSIQKLFKEHKVSIYSKSLHLLVTLKNSLKIFLKLLYNVSLILLISKKYNKFQTVENLDPLNSSPNSLVHYSLTPKDPKIKSLSSKNYSKNKIILKQEKKLEKV